MNKLIVLSLCIHVMVGLPTTEAGQDGSDAGGPQKITLVEHHHHYHHEHIHEFCYKCTKLAGSDSSYKTTNDRAQEDATSSDDVDWQVLSEKWKEWSKNMMKEAEAQAEGSTP